MVAAFLLFTGISSLTCFPLSGLVARDVAHALGLDALHGNVTNARRQQQVIDYLGCAMEVPGGRN